MLFLFAEVLFLSFLLYILNQKNILFEKHYPQSLQLDSLSNYDSFILSGRRKNEKKINEINSKIIKFCIKNNNKLLGICYGAEILALTLGGAIKKNKSLQKGNQCIKVFENNFILNNSLNVFESHNFEKPQKPEFWIVFSNFCSVSLQRVTLTHSKGILVFSRN